jgi:hypothetical protein
MGVGDSALRIVSWNVGRRTQCWPNLLDGTHALGADVALLQEAPRPPLDLVRDRISPAITEPWTTSGLVAANGYRAAVLRVSDRVELHPRATAPLGAATEGELPVSRAGTIALADVHVKETDERFTVASIYALWETPAPKTSWIIADASAHRLISDLSWLIGRERGHQLIVAGDLNLLRGYGENGSTYWAGRYATVFARMEALGLPFVGPRRPNGEPVLEPPSELPKDHDGVPTYRRRAGEAATATRQLDYVFASASLAPRLTVRARNHPDEWGPSDHCRVEIEVAG